MFRTIFGTQRSYSKMKHGYGKIKRGYYEVTPGCMKIIDLIVNRSFIAHLSLYTKLKPICDKKMGIIGLVYIIN